MNVQQKDIGVRPFYEALHSVTVFQQPDLVRWEEQEAFPRQPLEWGYMLLSKLTPSAFELLEKLF